MKPLTTVCVMLMCLGVFGVTTAQGSFGDWLKCSANCEQCDMDRNPQKKSDPMIQQHVTQLQQEAFDILRFEYTRYLREGKSKRYADKLDGALNFFLFLHDRHVTTGLTGFVSGTSTKYRAKLVEDILNTKNQQAEVDKIITNESNKGLKTIQAKNYKDYYRKYLNKLEPHLKKIKQQMELTVEKEAARSTIRANNALDVSTKSNGGNSYCSRNSPSPYSRRLRTDWQHLSREEKQQLRADREAKMKRAARIEKVKSLTEDEERSHEDNLKLIQLRQEQRADRIHLKLPQK